MNYKSITSSRQDSGAFLIIRDRLFFVRADHSQPSPALMTTAHRRADLGEIAILPHTHSHFVLFQAEGAIACGTVS
ncbi:MAG: hypothetical protein QNJ33_13150 [Crocosphaera sp.]|nr:hypothetical protein [Crocosphaera sp.]